MAWIYCFHRLLDYLSVQNIASTAIAITPVQIQPSVFSLAASYVRIRTHSVACSALLHATYNFTIFTMLFLGTGGFHHMEKLVT